MSRIATVKLWQVITAFAELYSRSLTNYLLLIVS